MRTKYAKQIRWAIEQVKLYRRFQDMGYEGVAAVHLNWLNGAVNPLQRKVVIRMLFNTGFDKDKF